MPGSEIAELLESLSARLNVKNKLNVKNQNECWQRIWLENEANKQRQTLRCPECEAFIPILPGSFDDDGRRICLLCGIKFHQEEY